MPLTLLLDLDDTLLEGSTKQVIPEYLDSLTSHLSHFVPAQQLTKLLLTASQKMTDNQDPILTLKQVFDSYFYPLVNSSVTELRASIDDFYSNIYPNLTPPVKSQPEVLDFLEICIQRGYQLALANNPIFPIQAALQRLKWAGINPERHPFQLISSYESFHFAKPSPAFYAEILARMGWGDTPVLVVGNDLEMDIIPAQQLGLPTYQVSFQSATQNDISSVHSSGPIQDIIPWLDAHTLEQFHPDYSATRSSYACLQATPAVLQTIISSVSSEAFHFHPSETEWGLTEILCHLRDVDMDVYLPRLTKILEEPSPYLEAVEADQWAKDRRYSDQDGVKAFVEFQQARKNLLDVIRNLPPELEYKNIRHTIFGPTSLAEILRISARHDRLHIQQTFSLLNSLL